MWAVDIVESLLGSAVLIEGYGLVVGCILRFISRWYGLPFYGREFIPVWQLVSGRSGMA